MAEKHSIEACFGSQVISSHFYQYHRQSGGIWYIKNNEEQFLDCSDDFLSFLQVKSRDKICLKRSEPLMSRLLGKTFFAIQYYERNISLIAPRVVLFVTASINDKLTPLIITINKIDLGVYVKIDDLSFLGVEHLILEKIGVKKKINFNKGMKIERLYDVNPFASMGEKEWCVAWLMSVGLSKSEMAEYLNVSDTIVKRRMGKVYRALLLKNYDNFMYVSNLLHWRRFVPPCVLQENTVSVLNLSF